MNQPLDTPANAPRSTPLGIVAWAVMGAVAAAVVVTAASLHADARGFGTHQQLGLPPCEFSAATGVPCPGCGLTTSFAQMAHGHFVGAFATHLMGPPLFLLTLAVALFTPWAIYKRRPLTTLLETPWSVPLLGLTSGLGLLTWILRVAHVLPTR